MAERWALIFGATAPPLHEQLGVSKALAKSWQQDADAITRLKVRGLLGEGEARTARQRLVRSIEKVATP